MANEIFHRLNLSNFDSKFSPMDMRMLRKAFGPESSGYFRDNMKGKAKYEIDFPVQVNHLFFQNLSREIGGNFTQEAYLSALKKANETHSYIVERLGLPKLSAGLINNVVAFSESPFDRLDLISKSNISPLLRYQLMEQLLLALIHIHLDNRTRDKKLRSQLSEFVKFTDEHLFESQKIGENREIEIFSTHDSENRTKTINLAPIVHVSNNEHQKVTPLRVREVHIGTKKYLVAFDIRKKDDRIAALKSLELAAHKSDGNIEIVEDVEDMIGVKFILIKGDMKEFITSFEHIVRNYYGDIEIENTDSHSEDGRKKTKRHTFKRRRLKLSNNNNNKLEVIFYTLREFLNSEYDVGELEEDGCYNGAAHSLYETRRIGHAASHLFPQDLYGLDIFEYVRQTQQREAERLLSENNVT